MASLYEASSSAASSSNQLHRELLRWIQSLDLAYSIKNVKRDFANGFLVAEILSRYYDKDVSMHSFDNGIGVKVKKDNWDQLLKVCLRVSDLEPLAVRADVDAVIHCQNGAAVAFLTKLYTCLTKRTIQPTVVAAAAAAGSAPPIARSNDPALDEIPPYAKPTGAAVIRDKMRAPDIAAVSDESEIHRKVRGVHAQHEEQLQLERLLAMDTPERYPSLRSASKATVLRGATKPVRNDDGPALVAQHVVKDVQIKSMNEKSLEKLRLNREARESEGGAGSGSSHGSGSSSASGGGGVPGASGAVGSMGVAFDHYGRSGTGTGSGTGELIQKRRPLDLLNEAVSRKLPPSVVAKLESSHRGKDKFDAFVDALHDGRIAVSDHDGADMLSDVVDDPLILAHAFLDFPKDFWKFAGALLPFLAEYDDDHALFLAVQHALLRIGKQSAKRDGTAAMVLLTDFLLPKITPLLATHSSKRAPLLQLVYAFAPETVLAHIQVIKRLREALPDDIPLFIHALSILLYMENELDDTLVDLYHYYCCIGLETPCEKLRAASLSMLVPFLSYDLSLVTDLLPRLTQFSSRNAWWEVKTQLLIVASAFLHAAAHVATSASVSAASATASSSRDYTEQIELALTLIEREFHPTAHLNVRRVGLSYLAKNLSQYQELVPLYVDVLLSIPLAMRTAMLVPQQEQQQSLDSSDGNTMAAESGNATPRRHRLTHTLPVRGTSGAHYELRALAPQWDSVAVAKQIYYERKARDHADVDAVQVLSACVAQLTATRATRDDAAALVEQMLGFIALGLLDAAACGVAAQLLLDVMRAGACLPRDVLSAAPLERALAALVTRHVEDVRQQCAVRLLHDAHPLDAAAVGRCVAAVAAQSDAATFRASLFSIAFDPPS